MGGGCQARFDGHNFTGTVESASEAAGVLGGKRNAEAHVRGNRDFGNFIKFCFFRCPLLPFRGEEHVLEVQRE